MQAYLAVFRVRMLLQLQYRLAALARLAPPLFVGTVQIMFFTAFFGSPTEQPLTLEQTIAYCWIIQMLVGVQPWNGDPDVLETIRTGNVAYELCRPIDLYGYWFSRLAARRLVPLLTSSLPLALIAHFLMPGGYRLGLPPSAASGLAFLLSLAGVVLLSSALSSLLGICTVWTVSGEGIYYLAPVIFMIFSGALVPLPFFPESLQGLIGFLPFRGLLDTPAQIYLGLVPPGSALRAVGAQLLWTAGFVLAGRALLRQALKSVVVQGG